MINSYTNNATFHLVIDLFDLYIGPFNKYK